MTTKMTVSEAGPPCPNSWIVFSPARRSRRGACRGHNRRDPSRSVDPLTPKVVDAFDSDVLIYAIVAGHELGRRVRTLFPLAGMEGADLIPGIGSVLLLPELLSKPRRERSENELAGLGALLSRLDLRPTDLATAELATALGASYRLRAADAVHLATAVGAGADRFLTNNRSDFPKLITEIDITYPDDLPVPSGD